MLHIVDIPGLEIVEELGRGAEATVYLAERDGRRYAVVVAHPATGREPVEDRMPRTLTADPGTRTPDRGPCNLEPGTPSSQPGPEQGGTGSDGVARFRRAAAARARVSHPALPAVLDAGTVEGRPYLVLEYPDGPLLAGVAAERRLPPERAITLARCLGGALGAMHALGLVHGNVTSASVVCSADGGFRLIDLGVALLGRDAADRALVGMVLDASLEQAGSPGRAIDGRSDLRALGWVLVEALTGRPQVQAGAGGDPLRQPGAPGRGDRQPGGQPQVRRPHQLAAGSPPDLAALVPELTPGLASIVARLLASDPEDRYPDAESVIDDLDRLPVLGNGQGAAPLDRDPAEPGPWLVGREAELARLTRLWARARDGDGAAVLLVGDRGMGKSALAAALVRHARPRAGLVLSARSEDERPEPLAAIRIVVDDWLRRVDRLPEAARALAQTHAVEAAGEIAPLVARLSPRLARVLGRPAGSMQSDDGFDGRARQPAPAPPDPVDALPESVVHGARDDRREQVYGAVALFLRRLAVLHGPAVLVLDDAHALDETSRQIVRRLAGGIAGTPLLLLAVARGDAASSAGLARLVDALELARPVHLDLGPIDAPAVGDLIERFLGRGPVDSAVAHWLVERWRGNPRAAVEHLRVLLDEGALRPSWRGWTLDRETLAGLRLPADPVDLVLRRVDALGLRTSGILTAAAAQLSPIDIGLLTAATGADPFELALSIANAARAGVIERDGARYRFADDRVRGALLARAEPGERRRLHQRIAAALDDADREPRPEPIDDEPARREDIAALHQVGPEPPPERLYAIARQYALGDVSRPERAYQANRAAGFLALADLADREAAEFLAAAREIAARTGRLVDPAIEEWIGDLAAREGRWSDAIAHYQSALDGASEDGADPRALDGASRAGDQSRALGPALQTARVHGRRARARMANGQPAEAWSDLRAGFARVGTRFPEPTLASFLYSLLLALLGLLVGRLRGWLPRPRGAARERLLAATHLYEGGAFLAHIEDNRRASAQMMLRCLYTAERLGPSPELATTYMGWATTLAPLRRRRLAARFAAAAIATAETTGDRFIVARADVTQAWAFHVGGEPRQGEAAAVRALVEHGAWLDVHSYAVGCNDLVWNLLLRGYCREGWRWLQEGLRRAAEASDQRERFASSAAALLAVLGRAAEAGGYLERARRVGGEVDRERWWWMDVLGKSVLVHLEAGELGERLDATIARRRELGLRPGGGSFHTHDFFVFQGYARLAQCLRALRSEQPAHLARLGDAVAELRRVALHPTLRCHLLVLTGALLDLRGEAAAALEALDNAEALANRHDNPWALFETMRIRGRVRRRLGDREAAGRQARFADALAAQHGWAGRARWVRTEFQLDSAIDPPVEPVGNGTREWPAPGRSPDVRALQRQLDALLQVSLTAGTVLDPDEQARVVLDEIIRILGAERGFLFLTGESDRDLLLRSGRGADGQDLVDPGGFSGSVLEAVRSTLEPVIVSGDDEPPAGSAGDGITAHRHRSIVAAPLMLHGRFLGVVYFENRLARGVFSQDELAILRALAVHIAIAVRIAEGFEATARLLDVVRHQVVDLQRSRQRITAAEERLRQEIAEMLHSRVQTRLLLAGHRLGEAARKIAEDPDQAVDELARVREDIDDIREREIRQASHLLHPAIIRVGLVPAVRSLTSRVGDQLAVELRVDPDLARLDDPIENRLSEPLRLAAYRFLEEALSNVQRHAKARRVWVAIGIEGGDVVATVRDDGVGFDPEKRGSGLGLLSIADRIDQQAGRWAIDSAPGQGTTLTARLPLEAPPQPEAEADPAI